jgi:hypothetical protein
MLRKFVLAAILLAFLVIVPALAEPDTIYHTEPVSLSDDSGLKIYLSEVIASDTPIGSYGAWYPSSEYRYYVVNYMVENPTESAIRWQYDIRFVDSNGTEYTPVDVMTGSTTPAGFKSTRSQPVEYAIPRTASDLYIRWYHIDTGMNIKVFQKIDLNELPATTPTPTPSPEATPTPTAIPTATPAPADGFLPVLAIGIIASSFILARIAKK